jgi:uncharacterized membrane protein YuzA (DUF378 family)
MTGVTRDDVRAAVASGTMTEAQAASLIVLAEERAGVRTHMTGLDEPFELFKGFNEIFIVVGLTILYLGFAGITGMTLFGTESGYILGVVYALIGMGGVIALARYFTLKRRMVAPSIALAIMFGFLAGQLGISVSAMFDLKAPQTLTATAATAALFLSAYYAVVPGALHRGAGRPVGLRHGLRAGDIGRELSRNADGYLPADGGWALRHSDLRARSYRPRDRHALRHVRPASRDATRGVGLLAPCHRGSGHREHRRADLFDAGTAPAQLLLTAFVAAMAVIAVVIDRRSFLVSGVGYVVALAITVAEGQAFFIILMLGAGLVLLGAQWEVLRRAIMRALPEFPGKTRLPPYDLLQKETPA